MTGIDVSVQIDEWAGQSDCTLPVGPVRQFLTQEEMIGRQAWCKKSGASVWDEQGNQPPSRGWSPEGGTVYRGDLPAALPPNFLTAKRQR
jgi:hypothetical protein